MGLDGIYYAKLFSLKLMNNSLKNFPGEIGSFFFWRWNHGKEMGVSF
jgi:hypothetical protein